MILMIDNYDSFTFNLVDYCRSLGSQLHVVRNDAISIDEIRQLAPDKIIISPGPCAPDQAGISLSLIEHFAGEIPILGVCLGHQSIAQVFGAKVIKAEQVMHGKTSMIEHTGEGVFLGLPTPFRATRYHSLVIDPDTLPKCLQMTAWVKDSGDSAPLIMGVKHHSLPIEGVQFHPESILTEHGHALLENFINQ